jgi:hypothetical protein
MRIYWEINIDTIYENTETLIDANNVVGVEVNIERAGNDLDIK